MGEGRPVEKETLRISECVRDRKKDVKMCAQQQSGKVIMVRRNGLCRLVVWQCGGSLSFPQSETNQDRE